MIQRINNYLLTRHPLIWNTRLVWVSLVNAALHFLFFIAGLMAISTGNIVKQYSVSNVSGGNHYILSILCGLLVAIMWCVFYLRNNAFKSFYRIGKWYLAKEFAIIFFVLFTCVTYFMTFEWGVRTRVRSITNLEQLTAEMNAVNVASVYLPEEEAPYFILNTCDERNRRKQQTNNTSGRDSRYSDVETNDYAPEVINSFDTTRAYNNADSARIRIALRRPDAFSYLNYCGTTLSGMSDTTYPTTTISQQNRRWLQTGRKDSVRRALEAAFFIFKKYNIGYRLSSDSIVADVFSDPYFTMHNRIAGTEYRDENGNQLLTPYFLNHSEVDNVFYLIEDCQLTPENFEDRKLALSITGYVALVFSILLLCYRRFSRRVFLISVVGTLVWLILIGLFSISSGTGDGLSIVLLMMCGGFLGGGLMLLKQKRSKAFTGVLLNWHVYLLPFAVLFLINIIDAAYERELSRLYLIPDGYKIVEQRFPVSHWVIIHKNDIALANIIAAGLYVAFLFNSWAKRWQASPEE